jgi:RHS repeat-associated protein
MPNLYPFVRRVLLLGMLSMWLTQSGHAQTILQPGELIITGLNANGPDDWSFAPLVDLAAGTQIVFTDKGWYANGGFRATEPTEGVVIYTVPAGGVLKGHLVSFQHNRADFSANSQLVLDTRGDQILAYQGTSTNPAFIYGLTTKGTWSDASSVNSTALPTSLQDGETALAVPWANAYMDESSLRSGPADSLQAWFTDASNWQGSNAAAVPVPPTDLKLEQGVVPDADELNALEALYLSTNGSQWSIRKSWPAQLPFSRPISSAVFGSWHGITVTNGDISAIQLDNNNLTGTLPPTLSKLRQLRVLALPGNYLRGGIPDEFRNLDSIAEIVLDNNEFSGDFPTVLSRLNQLQVISLAHNQFTGPLPITTAQWPHLKQLILPANRMTGILPVNLGLLKKLQALDLADNQFSGPLPESISLLDTLQTLDLSNNQFSGALPHAWVSLTRLAVLRLAHNRLTGPVPILLTTLPSLSFLDVARNQLTGTIPAFPGAATNRTFNFSYNHFTDLASYLSLPNLSSCQLDVQGNYLDFGALETNFTAPGTHPFAVFIYSEQRAITPADTTAFVRGSLVLLHRSTQGQHNYYQWQREVGAGAWTDIANENGLQLLLPQATEAQQGHYRVYVTNSWVPTTLATRAVYAGMVPYALLPENRPVDVAAPTLATAYAPASRGAITDTVNYVRTYTARQAFTDAGQLAQASAEGVQVKTEYLDGLGRSVQTVIRQESPSHRDVVQPVAYDELGRQPYQFLPYPSANASASLGSYHPDAIYEQYHFYRDLLTGPGNVADGTARTGVPYSETIFETSPLDRALAQAAPGEAWQMATKRVVSTLERVNSAQDSVQRFVPGYGAAASDITWRSGYVPGELWGTQTTNEEGYLTITWKDKKGQMVLKQVEGRRERDEHKQWHRRWLRTYYVYDDFGYQRAVLPPEAVKEMQTHNWQVTTVADRFLFRYCYDGRGRMISKQVPGTAGETLMVYNQQDLPLLSQDASQRTRNEWSFTKYDALSRPVLTGIVRSAGSQAALQTQADTTLSHYETRTSDAGFYPYYYTADASFPPLGNLGFTNFQVLTVTNYDDYNFDNDAAQAPDGTYNTQFDAQFPAGQVPRPDSRVIGQTTRMRTRILGIPETAPNAWLSTTTFYDERARPIQTQSVNARGGTDIATTQLDFSGKIIKSIVQHTGPNHAPIELAETFTYDHAGRLLTTAQQLGGEASPATTSTLRYNELGQLVRKTIGTNATTQHLDYAYNIRGWLTGLNDAALTDPGDLFGMELCYERGFTAGYEQYDGNITGQKWRSRHDRVERAYGYAYDPIGRLLQGDYVARGGASASMPWAAEAGNYRLSMVSYDDNGNILTLRRRGLLAEASRTAPKHFGPVDMLSYRYTGNRLLAVDDQVSTNQLPRPAGYNGAPASLAGDFQEQAIHQATEYLYDANGNLTQDRNKGITNIAYNHLNLPRRIVFGSAADSLVFRYTAGGQKVAKLVYQTGKPMQRTDYLGAYQYEQDSLRFFPHAEGRVLRFVSRDAAGQPQVRYVREYTIKDHLGNLRVAYRRGNPATYRAGLEPDDAPQETQQFDSLSVSPPIATDVYQLARTGRYVARLNAGGTTPRPIGAIKLLPVQKGDTIILLAHGLYPAPIHSSNLGFSMLGFAASLLQQSPPTPGIEPNSNRRSLMFLNIGLSLVPALLPNNSGTPNGYVRLLVFNADSNLVASYTQQLSSAALHNYEALQVQVIAPADGYVQTYVGNESNGDVYFDDVEVQHHPGLLVQENHYDPWGLNLAGLDRTGGQPMNKYQFNGKEKQPELGLGWQDYGARMYDAQLGRWHSVDPLADTFNEWGPYSFVRCNPAFRIDPNGKWDITVHAYSNRSQHGYGIAIVTDRKGNEMQRFDVRLEGASGHNRMQTNGDTPTGTYDIPDKGMWITPKKTERDAYGPNPRLILTAESGEIKESGRSQIRIHGGRQEHWDAKAKAWTPRDKPTLGKTNGCLRCKDTDIATLKSTTDGLEAADKKEGGGKLTIIADLQENKNLLPIGNTYTIPEKKTDFPAYKPPKL